MQRPLPRCSISPVLRTRFGVLVVLSAIFLSIHTVLRVTLMIASGAFSGNAGYILLVVVTGLASDLYPLAIAVAVGACALALIPGCVWRTSWHRALMLGGCTVIVALALVEAVAEGLFWAEFETRFNFLAVEYLIYRDEVAKNILQSYSVGRIVAGLSVAAILLLWLLRRPLRAAIEGDSSLRSRAAVASVCVLLAAIPVAVAEPEARRDARSLELARNGVYQFVSAFRANEIDYDQFYLTRPADAVRRALQARLQPPATSSGAHRQVTSSRPERRMNVMFVAVESLSASFLGVYGSEKGLTPALDALARQSLWFSNVYATGTRTVRGLEALSLSIPPTPGHSIVKRPGSADGLRTIGLPFQERGYDTAFFTGTFGYFDNMNAFFGGAGFRVVDRASFRGDEVTFTNAWGIADENVFDRVLRDADASSAAGRAFMFFTLTGSNHRPYTFPEGRIDLPQRTRDAAVKYTDWAIGRFLEDARTRPWFDNTVFVIVADHCARSGGRTELPIENFRIPLFVYAPAAIEPRDVHRLVSQIDVAPTLLNLLGFDYDSTFLGQDMLAAGEDRAFVASYEALGLYRDDRLTVLLPHRHAAAYAVHGDNTVEQHVRAEDLDDTITYYQGASQVYRSGELALGDRPSR